MNVNSNAYTFGFAGVMVILAALLLSTAAISLKDRQNKNIEMEKKQSILAAIREFKTREESDIQFGSIITRQYAVDVNGAEKQGVKAFDVELADEFAKPADERSLPVYVATKNDSTFYIVPVRGKGLWGPIWGFIALQGDLNTVYGAFFDHKSETPGLGAEITKTEFESQYIGKKLDNEADFGLIEMRKGDASGAYQVDGISGGTITSVGVEAMIKNCLTPYRAHFNALKSQQTAPAGNEPASTETKTVTSLP
jgi:Na+-transporting NADH:ubiquinone oxidoreductase subunit C